MLDPIHMGLETGWQPIGDLSSLGKKKVFCFFFQIEVAGSL